MEVGHDEDTEGNGDETEDFNAIVIHDTTSNVFGDLTIKNNAGPASGEN